jgi:hypothetical protein
LEEESGRFEVDRKRFELSTFAGMWWPDDHLSGVEGVLIYLVADLEGRREQRRLQ